MASLVLQALEALQTSSGIISLQLLLYHINAAILIVMEHYDAAKGGMLGAPSYSRSVVELPFSYMCTERTHSHSLINVTVGSIVLVGVKNRFRGSSVCSSDRLTFKHGRR